MYAVILLSRAEAELESQLDYLSEKVLKENKARFDIAEESITL